MFHITSTTSDQTGALPEAVLVRRATAADDAQIRALARLEDQRMPSGPFLVAEVDGSVAAAVSLSNGAAVADPFRLTGDAVAMLRLRALQIGGAPRLAERRTLAPRERAVSAAFAA